MSNMVEIDIDFTYCGEVDMVLAHDEFGQHESTIFKRIEQCEMEYSSDFMGWHCKSCDNIKMGLRDQKPRFCPNCGREVISNGD